MPTVAESLAAMRQGSTPAPSGSVADSLKKIRAMPPPEDTRTTGQQLAAKIAPYARPALETGGLLFGGAAGTAAEPGLGTVGGAALGYAAGRKASDILEEYAGLKSAPATVTEAVTGTAKDVATGAALELGGQAVGAVAKVAKPFLTARRGAETLNILAEQEAKKMVAKLEPPRPSSQLFKEATQSGVGIPMPQTQAMAQTVQQTLKTLSKEAGKQKGVAAKWADGLLTDIRTNPAGFTPEKLNQELIALGQALKHNELKPVRGELKQLFKAINQDLDAAANQPGAQTLKVARATFRREASIGSLSDYIDLAAKDRRGYDTRQFNANEVIRKLRTDDYFPTSFTKEEQADIFKTLKTLNEIPSLPPPRGVAAGSKAFWEKTALVGTAAAAGGLTHGGAGAMEAGAAAIAGTYLYDTGHLISMAMRMPEGRALIRQLAQEGRGSLTPKAMVVLSKYVTEEILPKEYLSEPEKQTPPPPPQPSTETRYTPTWQELTAP
jgi:hypothetical protein